MLKRLEKFPENHPLLVKILGLGLCLAGAGAGAVTVPAVMAALGLKLAVMNGSTILASGAAASLSAAVPAAAASTASALLAGSQILLSTVAIDLGGKLLAAAAGPPSARTSRQRVAGWLGIRRGSASSSEGRIGVLDDVPLLLPRKK